ncbi:MAG: hypothetical protein ACI4F2_03895 [Acutalibacteraceae bacterium]
MNTISECAKLYKTLLKKEFIFTLEQNIKFKLEFNPAYFFHLLALEKLTDIVKLKGKSPGKIYKDICRGNITDRTVRDSKHYRLVSDRVRYFEQLPELLCFSKSNKIIVDFDRSKLSFESKLTNTKYILYKRIDNIYSHLTIGCKGCKNILYPETFIVENGSTYISNQTMLDILSIDVVQK